MATDIESFFREILVFIGDVNRMEIKLDTLFKQAKAFGVDVDLEDLLESEKTINRLKNETNVLHDKVNGNLDGEQK